MAHDRTVPSFTIPDDNTKRIVITISASDASVLDQGYTYNEAGLTYNQANTQYGGLYKGNQDQAPTILTATLKPSLTIAAAQTDATLTDQGYTYNQANFTYNQEEVIYGGLSQANHDQSPTLVTASILKPRISEIEDIYIHPNNPPGPNDQTTVGPGWFMYVSQ